MLDFLRLYPTGHKLIPSIDLERNNCFLSFSKLKANHLIQYFIKRFIFPRLKFSTIYADSLGTQLI
jgi:hypothetical protein